MDSVLTFVSGVVVGLIVPWISRVISWLVTQKHDGGWEVRVFYLRGRVDREQKYHRIVVPPVLEDGLEVSLDGTIGGVFRIERGWPLAYPIGWLGKKRGFGLWRNEWGWWGFWTAHRRPPPEPPPPMKPGRPTQPPTPKR